MLGAPLRGKLDRSHYYRTNYFSPTYRIGTSGLGNGNLGWLCPFGCAFAIISAPYLIEQGSWQLVWQAGLLFSVIVCLFGWLFIPNDSRPIRYNFDIAPLRRAVCLPLLTFIGLSFACHSLVYQTLIQFTPLITQSFSGISSTEGALITGLFCIMNFFGNLIAGRALQLGCKPTHIIRFTFSIVPLLLIALVLFNDSSPLLFLLLSLVGLVTGGSAPIFFYLVSRSNQDPKDLPVFVAWTFQIQGLGMLIGPALVGWVVDMTQELEPWYFYASSRLVWRLLGCQAALLWLTSIHK